MDILYIIVCVIRKTEAKGWGVYQKKNIRKGEEIFKERTLASFKSDRLIEVLSNDEYKSDPEI